MTPVFNTGRVQIGLCYIRPAMRIQGDMLPLQAALLDKRTPTAWTRILNSVYRWL